MMEREDYYFTVMRILPHSYKSEGSFYTESEALRLMLTLSAEHPFDDYRVILHQWSYRLGCYIGARIV